MKAVIDLLRESSVAGLDVDGDLRMRAHASVLKRKRLLRGVFQEFHRLFNKLDLRLLSGNGLRVELGAGVAPIRDSYPDVLSTDVIPGPGIDMVIDAEAMNLEASSVRVFFGQNCFHHFPRPDKFFCELERVLNPGGGAILIEPFYGPAASFLFKRMFRTEGYDKDSLSWDTEGSGPMNGANQALSYIVFVRDRDSFINKHPSLEIVHMAPCDDYLRYLLSGGLNFRQLCPDWCDGFIRFFQYFLKPLIRVFALHHVVVIRKKSQ